MCFAAALQQLKVPLRFTSMTASKSSSPMRAMSPSRVMPALFTSTSMRPSSATAWSTRAFAASVSATLATTASVRTPYSLVISSAAALVRSKLESLEQLRQTS